MAHDIDDLKPLLRVELPGIPEPVLDAALWESVDEFLRESEAWRYTIPGLLDWETTQPFPDMVAGVELPVGARVARIDSVKYASDGVSLRKVPFKTRQQMDDIYSDWEVKTGNTPQYWLNDGFSGSDTTPTIVPIATANVIGSLKIRVIIALDSSTAFVVPEFIVHEFGDVIRYATLARLMKMPGKDWTNLGAAAAYAQMFNSGVRKAQSKSSAGYGQPCREASYGGL